MKRTTVKLDDEVDARVRHEAARRGMTVSEWVREAVEAHLPRASDAGPSRPGQQRTFLSAAAGGSGGTERLAARAEEILAGIYAERDRARAPRDA